MFSWMGLLEASAAGGICILLFFLVSQLLGERYQAKYKKVIWILIALRMCIPVSTSFFPHPVTVQVPTLVWGERQLAGESRNGAFMEGAVPSEGERTGNGMPADMGAGGAASSAAASADGEAARSGRMAERTGKLKQFTSQDILIMLWACGSAAVLVYYLLVHFFFCRRMMKKSSECTDRSILAMAAGMAGEMGIKNVPQIRLIKDAQTGPFTEGFFRNTVFLPDGGYQERDLRYILRHELAHCAGKDTRLKVLFIAVNALHWFNPFIWFMKSMADQDMELACDETVLKDASREERNEYSEVLMACIGTDKAGRPVLSTGYVQGVKFIKRRFRNIFNIQKKSGVAAVCILVALLMAVSGLVGFEAGRTVYAKSGIIIDSGIELRTDVTGDGAADRVQVYDDTYVLTTSLSLQTADGEDAFFRYNDEMWAESYLVSGDLDGNGAADILVMRISNGMHGAGDPSVLYVEKEEGVFIWKEYPENFVKNPAIEREQPDGFDDIICIGATVIEADGCHCLRLVAIDWDAYMENGDEDTVWCIDCSWNGDGWYIEDMRTVEGFYSENKKDELLRNNIDIFGK